MSLTQNDPRLLETWLAEVEYRPGWDLTLDHEAGVTYLTIRAQVDDSRDPGTCARQVDDSRDPGTCARQVAFVFKVPVPEYLPGYGREDFYRWLAHILWSGPEQHESAEWLRWRHDHRPLFDPHDRAVRL